MDLNYLMKDCCDIKVLTQEQKQSLEGLSTNEEIHNVLKTKT